MTLLSIIVPFYNSAHKCGDILRRLAGIDDEDVEIILVNDGSTDDTLTLLTDFSREHPRSRVITQDNRGPGGARNTGIRAARGAYVWMVDSDDDILPEAIESLRPHAARGVDFVDFNHAAGGKVVNGMHLAAGHYSDESVRRMALEHFGSLWTKMIRRDFILEHNLLYPEYCYYEDNAFNFICPFVVRSFGKSEQVAYVYRSVADSVSRERPTARYFDRMHVAAYGLSRALAVATAAERDPLIARFMLLYLYNTVGRLIASARPMDWINAIRVMRRYRTVAAKHIGKAPWPWRKQFGWFDRMGRRTRVPAVALYCASYVLGDQAGILKGKGSPRGAGRSRSRASDGR